MGKKGKYNQKNDEDEGKKKNFIITQQHLMDKTHMQITQYMPLLPQDSLYQPFKYSQNDVMILRNILKQLNFILYVDFKRFWATLLYNPSFKTCIHSCINFFHRRWLNQYMNKSIEQVNEINQKVYKQVYNTEAFQYTQSLMKVILLIYYRIANFQQENAELSTLYNIKSEIVTKYILDVPRLLEIIQVYGDTNEGVVKGIIKQYTNLSTTLYSDFTQEIIQPLIAKLNKNLMLVKKTTDRQEFGIQYNYKRNATNQLSPGQTELQKKVQILMEIISFYLTLNNIYMYFPSAWAQSTKFNLQLHTISENIFIEIQQAYKIWNTHEQGQTLYSLMNMCLKYVIKYFIEFLQKCQAMFITKNIKSNYKQAYMKCLDRMIQNYGKRASLGKKTSNSKRYMHMYRELLKLYRIDEFTSKLYVQEVQNSTYGINLQYLTDFKIALDQQMIKIQGRPAQLQQMQEQQKTQAGNDDDDENQEQFPVRKLSKKSQINQLPQSQQILHKQNSVSKQIEELTNLQMMISKRNRQEDYYSKLYKDYRCKMVVEYDDQYDDLVDYEKRPMFQDNNKQEQDSSDDSSGEEFDDQVQKLHLVKSNSNVSRERGLGTQHHYHQKYQRKNKAKFVPMKQTEAKAIINKEFKEKGKQYNKFEKKQKPVYLAKQVQKTEQKPNSKTNNKKQYNDQQCYQQCRAKIKEDKQKQKKSLQMNNNKYQNNENESDNSQNGGGQDKDRGQRGRGRGRGNYNNNKTKGTNTNKKKYVEKS